MGTHLQLRLFKGTDDGCIRSAFEEAVRRQGGRVEWDGTPEEYTERLRMAHGGGVHSVFLQYLAGKDFLICNSVGALLDCVWIEVRIQEGAIWEYVLYAGTTVVDRFCTLPEYWGSDDSDFTKEWQGRPRVLADRWGIPVQRIERYLAHWGCCRGEGEVISTTLRGRAYPSDRFEYADPWQMVDFVEALGGEYPDDDSEHATEHRIVVPLEDP